MTTIRLPGLIDAHVHMREPGFPHKESFASGTAAALAGGVTTVLDMPNTLPPTSTPERLRAKAALAAAGARCDVGLFVGATTDDLDAYLPAAHQACALKIYVSDTFGSLRIDSLTHMDRFFRGWSERWVEQGGRGTSAQVSEEATDPSSNLQSSSLQSSRGLGPIAVHAEELALPTCLALSALYHVPLHVVHVSRRSEIELIARAKDRGWPVSCEVCPHHLFLSTDDLPRLGTLGDMRPRLASPDDVAALWQHLSIVDLFATDHAPHTLAEKRANEPPPGVPGVQTMLPLLLAAVDDGRLTLDDIVARCCDGPRRIYGLPEQHETWVEIDMSTRYLLRNDEMLTHVGWTPFAGREVVGRIERVVLRGLTAFDGERVLAEPGDGRVLFAD